MFLDADQYIFSNARALREKPTHAESILWLYLRKNSLGYKFRRQHPISVYIADFYCHALKLIIEVDGGIHNKIDVQIHDHQRQKHLESEGISFLRFTNEDVETNIEKVVAIIREYIQAKQNTCKPNVKN